MAKFIFDGPNKKIIFRDDSVTNGVAQFTVADLWREWCDWAATGDNLKYAPALDSLMVPLSATEFVGPYLFFRNDLGWRGVPPAANPCTIIIEGSFFGSDPMLPVMENLEAQATELVINRSVLTNTMVTSGTAGPTAAEIAATVWSSTNRSLTDKTGFAPTPIDTWDVPIEGSFTAVEVMRLLAAAMVGKVSGAETTTIRFRDLNDTTDRITANIDADGNRSSVVKNVI